MADVGAIIELGIESLEVNDPYPELRISRDKIRNMTIEIVSSASHFAWVDDRDGRIVGAVCALSHEMMFYERRQLSVVMFYCREPGGGGFMIRQLVKWFKTRPILKLCMFTLEHGADPRIGELLVKLGLNRELPNYVGLK